MDVNRPYISVSCDLVDQIEIFATSRNTVTVIYKESGKERVIKGIVETWFTFEKVEYLRLISGLEIRLDDVVSIDGFQSHITCSI